jgi:NAD(P)-dependent dehydrogenase (short-subunit alcohol dehydrogenase family)
VEREYRGKVAVITGAAGGLGRALARELGARHSHLALVDIDARALAQAGAELANPKIVVTAHCADVASEHDLKRVAAEVWNAHGAVHLLINNAAIAASASFLNTPAEEFDRIVQTNFFGVVNGCRTFLPLLRKSGTGQIVNVASCFAWVGYRRKSAYSASKGAIRAFSESLRAETAEHGVGVTLLYPGPIHTAILQSGSSDSPEALQREKRFLERRGSPPEYVARRALDRLAGNPSRIVIGSDYRAIDLLSRLSPSLAGWLMRLGSERMGF